MRQKWLGALMAPAFVFSSFLLYFSCFLSFVRLHLLTCLLTYLRSFANLSGDGYSVHKNDFSLIRFPCFFFQKMIDRGEFIILITE